jgi:4'-phosphopantetheinyl transferase
MPIIFKHHTEKNLVCVWHITESLSWLALQTSDEISKDLPTHTKKLAEQLAARILVQQSTQLAGIPYSGIEKDAFGKPRLMQHYQQYSISVSHSYPFVACQISEDQFAGVDIEQVKDKVLRVAHRVFNEDELHAIEKNAQIATVYWCAKEALIKTYGKKDLFLKDEIAIDSFKNQYSGITLGYIHKKGFDQKHKLQYLVKEDFVLVFTDNHS